MMKKLKFLNDLPINNDLIIEECKIRNVLLLGSTSGGKTTMKNMIINPKTVAGRYSAYSKTKFPTVECLICTHNKQKYNINFIDTPGLFEKTIDNRDRTISEIQSVIIDCIQQEVTKIHCVFFFFAYTSVLRDQDKDAIKEFLTSFPNLKDKAYIIFTRCENIRYDVIFSEEKLNINQDINFISTLSNNPQNSSTTTTTIKTKDENNDDELEVDFKIWRDSLLLDPRIKYFIEQKKYLISGCIEKKDVVGEHRNSLEICYNNIQIQRKKK